MIDESFKGLIEKVEKDLESGEAEIYWRPSAEEKDNENVSRINSTSDIRREI